MTDRAILAIEFGGTKLQWAVARADGTWADIVRRSVRPSDGAEGILRATDEVVNDLAKRYPFCAIGIGFGGPVDRKRGVVATSHQIDGWDQFPLADWCRRRWNVPVAIGNDCDVSALAEASIGAGRGASSCYYVTVGSGIGGGFVLDGSLVGADRPAAAEIGHLRPGIDAIDRRQTVESIASGWGIARRTQRLLANPTATTRREETADLLRRCDGEVTALDARHIAEAAVSGNLLARQAIAEAVRVLGWAIAQVITITATEVVVVGGGVSHMPPSIFWRPLESNVAGYVFPPLEGAYSIRSASLGDEVVLHGARLLAQETFSA